VPGAKRQAAFSRRARVYVDGQIWAGSAANGRSAWLASVPLVGGFARGRGHLLETAAIGAAVSHDLLPHDRSGRGRARSGRVRYAGPGRRQRSLQNRVCRHDQGVAGGRADENPEADDERPPESGDRPRLKGYEPPSYKLSYGLAEQIRERYNDGESVSSLARSFDVAGQTIHPILDRRIYAVPEPSPWLALSQVIRGGTVAGTGLTWAELYWLAGWLEGEGSFLRPPPSDPRRARIAAHSCDYDVLQEVGRLIRVTPQPDHRAARQRNGWSPSWRVLCRGTRAVLLMEAIAPIMGRRRKRQIKRALDAAYKVGAGRAVERGPAQSSRVPGAA